MSPDIQFCAAPAQRPTDTETLLYQARAEQLMPGDGGPALRALPAGLPLALEIPMQKLARSVGARRNRVKTEALLAAL